MLTNPKQKEIMKKFKIDFLDSDKCIAFTKLTKWETIEDCRLYAYVVMMNKVTTIQTFNITQL
jgi:hypothetical protein